MSVSAFAAGGIRGAENGAASGFRSLSDADSASNVPAVGRQEGAPDICRSDSRTLTVSLDGCILDRCVHFAEGCASGSFLGHRLSALGIFRTGILWNPLE